MARRLLEEQERWVDPIVAEVRNAREELFAGAGYDLDEFCKQLRERQQEEGRRVVSLSPRRVLHHATESGADAKPNKRMQPTRKKRARG